MAVICAKVGIVGNGANVLANRWFQPLTHVSEARTPRESARAGQEGKREKREISGSSWHMLRHSLFPHRSANKLAPTACRRPGPTKTHWRCEMANEDVPEMYRGSQKQIDGYRWVRELARDIDNPSPARVAAPGPRREVTYRPLPAVMTIYFIRSAAGPIKIGRASRVEFRLKDLRLASPVPLDLAATIEGPPSLERDYHKRFAAHRLHGEWFDPAPEILAEIERLSA